MIFTYSSKNLTLQNHKGAETKKKLIKDYNILKCIMLKF